MLYQLSYVGDRTRMRLKTPTSVDTQRALALSLERETGFEPATPSLEGSCSSQLSYSRMPEPKRGFDLVLIAFPTRPKFLLPENCSTSTWDSSPMERGGFEPPKA